MLMLIGMPLAIGLGYSPQAATGQEQFFEMTRQLRGNLMAFLFTLVCHGIIPLVLYVRPPTAKISRSNRKSGACAPPFKL